MMWVDYYINEVTNNGHETFIEGNQVVCNELTCKFMERFETLEDAEVIQEIHAEATSAQGTS